MIFIPSTLRMSATFKSTTCFGMFPFLFSAPLLTPNPSFGRYERSGGHLFNTFEDFLAFSWPVIVVIDAWTRKARIVTRLNYIGAFLKMIKTRFGETLPQAPDILLITPFKSTSRHLRNVSDYTTYRKLYSTLPAAILSALDYGF
ncbi:hypothetical protein D9758_014533 [Tetrapyrgos nigripes]|uniref:Uncharacterized protein n=1 Tax=Tetrapyrgos nigripes TaxID=182062 RepID=A0A8H5CVR0_9AGAR|nr:hypothetical protein D9758_014533 [Tetrapyrgos nigripes]